MNCSRKARTSLLVPTRCPVASGVSPIWFLAFRSAPNVTRTCTVSVKRSPARVSVPVVYIPLVTIYVL